MKKKLIAGLIALMILVIVFTGCAQQPAEPSNEATASSTDENVSTQTAGDVASDSQTPPQKKVGVVIWSVEDATTASTKRLLDYAAEALNIELIYKTGDYDTEAQLKAVENFIAAGVDGIMMMPQVDAGIPKFVKICEEAKIPYVQFYRYVVDEENKAALEQKKDVFLGTSMPDDEAAGEKMIQILAEQGCTNIGVIGLVPGVPACDSRQKGFQNMFDKGVAKKVAEVLLSLDNISSQNWTEATNNLISAYPEIDGIALSAGANGGSEATIAAIEQNNAVGKVKVAEFDVPENSTEAFEKGILAAVANGMQLDPMIALVILANKMNGTPLSDDSIVIHSDYVYVTSYEEDVAYCEYIDSGEVGVYPFTQDEIKQMYKFYNPAFTAEDLQKVADAWNMNDLYEKLVN